MKEEEKIKMYEAALAAWGLKNQVFMVMEESGELLNALAKTNRGRATAKDVITELADVSIMTEQIAVHFGYEDFKAEKERKLQRLKDKLNLEPKFK